MPGRKLLCVLKNVAQPVHAIRRISLLALACTSVSALHAQTLSNVLATTRFTAIQPGSVLTGHPKFLFLDQSVAGGDPFTDSFYQELKLSADLRKGRMSGGGAISNPYLITGRRTELKAHFRPRYRVERAPGNNTSVVIPVQWTVRLKSYALNYTDVASGSSDSATASGKVLLSAQSPNAGGILAQVIYHHQGQFGGQQPISFTVEKTVQTAGASQVQEGFNFDPVSETVTNYFKVSTANNGSSMARIDHPPNTDTHSGFRDVLLTVRHNALPGNGVAFFIWLEMDTVAGAYGTGTALSWEDFDLRYSVPPGYQLVAVDGLDLSGLDQSQPAAGPPVSAHPIANWQWLPEQNQLALSFQGVTGKALEVQETTDFVSGWDTIQRIETSSPGDTLEVRVPGGPGNLNVPINQRFYRVVSPAE